MPSTIVNTFDELNILLDLDLKFLDFDAEADVETTAQVLFDLPFLQLQATGNNAIDGEVEFDLQPVELSATGTLRRQISIFNFSTWT